MNKKETLDSTFARAVLDSQVARIAVVDKEGIIIAVNEPWKRFALENGADEKTINGIGIDYMVAAGASGEEDVEESLEGIRQVLGGNLPLYSTEYFFDMPEGKFWFEMFVTPLKRTEGGAVIAHNSIDKRKQAELLIYQQRAHLNAIFQGAEEGILAITSRKQVARVNGTGLSILGLKKNDIIGKNFRMLFGGELGLLDDYIEKTLETSRSFKDIRIEVDLPIGFRILFANVRPLKVEDHDFHEALVVLRDMTGYYALQSEVDDHRELGELIGKSKRMVDVYNLIKQVAPSKTNVLILGESGTGKGLIASLIHKYSSVSNGPFVAVNCAALSDQLLQSELFGHVKGAFTGAVADRSGRFQRANGGTIFLDEIGDISPAMQVSLLRVLEERQFEKLGDTRTLQTDARIIAATNQNLYARVQEGKFREDLFYRLNVVTLHVPPLRDRSEDIPLLANHFREYLNREMGSRIDHCSMETIRVLQSHHWPGNVRELRNAMERAFIMCNGDTLLPVHLPREIFEHKSGKKEEDVPVSTPVIYPNRRRKLSKADLELALEENGWNITHSAKALGYTRQNIYHLMRKHSIQYKD